MIIVAADQSFRWGNTFNILLEITSRDIALKIKFTPTTVEKRMASKSAPSCYLIATCPEFISQKYEQGRN
jgi:hypothetical protein